MTGAPHTDKLCRHATHSEGVVLDDRVVFPKHRTQRKVHLADTCISTQALLGFDLHTCDA